MLSQEAAKTLGYKDIFSHSIETPSFLQPCPLWIKQKIKSSLTNQIALPHKYSFHKIGKTFGFETSRYVEYKSGIFLYYDGPKQKQQKGYCVLHNVYMVYLKIDSQYLLHLTNGNEYSQFYLQNNDFFQKYSRKFLKIVIQLNFEQKYSLGNMIGKGSFSKVYQGINCSSGQIVAVKVVGKKDKNGMPTQNIVAQEKKIMGLLNSPYLCQMQEFYEKNQVFIFVLEYIQGKDLMAILKQNNGLSYQTMIDILQNTLKGLVDCHQSSIIHRDIKPQNIIVDLKNNSCKIIDFGLSLYIKSPLDKNKFRRCGTMGYMAFEVISNTAEVKKPYNQKCDMFSFGIVAHMVLFGYNPLKGKNYQETFKKNSQCNIILNEQQICKQYGISCYKWLQGLLAKDPSNRPSAQEALKSQFFKQARKSIKQGQKIQLMSNNSKIIVHHQEQNVYESHKQTSQDRQETKIPQISTMVMKKTNFD